MRTRCLPLVFAVLAWPAFAQSPGRPQAGAGNPAFSPPTAPKAEGPARESQRLNNADRLFLREAALSRMAGGEAIRLGQEKHAAGAMGEFIESMRKHLASLDQRIGALRSESDVATPAALDKERSAMLDELRGATGPAFERRFWTMQIAEHQKAAQLLAYEIGAGRDPQVKALASDSLPTVLDHLRQAQANAAQAKP